MGDVCGKLSSTQSDSSPWFEYVFKDLFRVQRKTLLDEVVSVVAFCQVTNLDAVCLLLASNFLFQSRSENYRHRLLKLAVLQRVPSCS